jgi:transcriptional regulator with XRE-family HTH domain
MRRLPEEVHLVNWLVGWYGLAQRDIARRLGVHETSVSQWRNGRRRPTKRQFEALRQLVEDMHSPSERRAAVVVERIARIHERILSR